MNRQRITAIGLMLATALSFSLMQVFIKLSAGAVGTFQQAFFRNLITLAAAWHILRRKHVPIWASVRRAGWSIWTRSLLGFFSVTTFFYAAGHGRQTDVAMLSRSMPVFVMLLSVPILKERLTAAKALSAALCMAGAYISMQPSFDSAPLPIAAALVSAVLSAAAYTALSYCQRQTEPNVIIFHFAAVSTGCCALWMLPDFTVPSPRVLLYLCMIGVFAACGEFFLTYAYRNAPASEVSIYQYSGVVFTAILSLLIFGEPLCSTTVLGGALIFAAMFGVLPRRRAEAS